MVYINWYLNANPLLFRFQILSVLSFGHYLFVLIPPLCFSTLTALEFPGSALENANFDAWVSSWKFYLTDLRWSPDISILSVGTQG